MGNLAHFDIRALMQRYGAKHFAETGTGQGHGVAHAAQFRFHSIRSCELEQPLADAVAAAYKIDSRVHIFRGDSLDFLSCICEVLPANEPIVFWLDAHFPGADYGLKSFANEQNAAVRLPLRKELELIAEARPKSQDVILVDDLRIWIDGAFGHGNLPAEVRAVCPKNRNADFFKQILGHSHDIKFEWADEGYVSLTPKFVE